MAHLRKDLDRLVALPPFVREAVVVGTVLAAVGAFIHAWPLLLLAAFGLVARYSLGRSVYDEGKQAERARRRAIREANGGYLPLSELANADAFGHPLDDPADVVRRRDVQRVEDALRAEAERPHKADPPPPPPAPPESPRPGAAEAPSIVERTGRWRSRKRKPGSIVE